MIGLPLLMYVAMAAAANSGDRISVAVADWNLLLRFCGIVFYFSPRGYCLARMFCYVNKNVLTGFLDWVKFRKIILWRVF